MFSSHDRLNKRTPEHGINRREYIGLLVDEYYETRDIGEKHCNANDVGGKQFSEIYVFGFLFQRHRSKSPLIWPISLTIQSITPI